MHWEIVLGVVIAIGITTAIIEARAKRSVRKKEANEIIAKQHPAMEESEKRRK